MAQTGCLANAYVNWQDAGLQQQLVRLPALFCCHSLRPPEMTGAFQEDAG